MTWINCKDQLPANMRDVLVYCPEYPDECFVATYISHSMVYGKPMFYEMLNDMYYDPERITHWCPLPKLPNKKDWISYKEFKDSCAYTVIDNYLLYEYSTGAPLNDDGIKYDDWAVKHIGVDHENLTIAVCIENVESQTKQPL